MSRWDNRTHTPIYHEVFDGNQAESPTLMSTLKKVLGVLDTSSA